MSWLPRGNGSNWSASVRHKRTWNCPAVTRKASAFSLSELAYNHLEASG